MQDHLNHICVSISGKSLNDCVLQLGNAKLAELRLDLVSLSPEEVSTLTSMGHRWIISIRQPFLMLPDCEKLFFAALNSTTRFVDVGFDLLSNPIALNCIEKARNSKTKLMLSYHNFESTPSFEELMRICSEMSLAGADALKIACLANTESDNDVVMKLYDHFENITAFCMGEHGRNSRIRSLMNGLNLTYASSDIGPATAPGQYSFSEMCALAEIAFQKGESNE
ncbi:MAG: hypothetical protein CVU11_16110 [Bacteroidetes bacterium HGW-Bacteroidetes-6]|jgi:3-dehydroquinate dehydratase-1|nr:MAG: hypothetical protein CVU11_16110 [Bacteroidetes bacterium HGW-Bacteroidetes-6]